MLRAMHSVLFPLGHLKWLVGNKSFMTRAHWLCPIPPDAAKADVAFHLRTTLIVCYFHFNQWNGKHQAFNYFTTFNSVTHVTWPGFEPTR